MTPSLNLKIFFRDPPNVLPLNRLLPSCLPVKPREDRKDENGLPVTVAYLKCFVKGLMSRTVIPQLPAGRMGRGGFSLLFQGD
jgi:hypothetical protein